MLADEPTGALDSETSLQVMDLLKEIAKDKNIKGYSKMNKAELIDALQEEK